MTDVPTQEAKKKDDGEIIAIFHATREPNAKGEFNWLEWKKIPKVTLKILQTAVGGRVTLLPYLRPGKPPFECYAQDDGLLVKGYGRNDLAGGSLWCLGFGGGEILGCAYAGNVVVTGIGGCCGLTSQQQNALLKGIAQYREDDPDDDTEEDA
jgi:hypothetical protein